MGFKLVIIGEDNKLDRFLGTISDSDIEILSSFAAQHNLYCLQGLDPQGDTIFNSLQIEKIKDEIQIVESSGVLNSGLFTLLQEAFIQMRDQEYLFVKFEYVEAFNRTACNLEVIPKKIFTASITLEAFYTKDVVKSFLRKLPLSDFKIYIFENGLLEINPDYELDEVNRLNEIFYIFSNKTALSIYFYQYQGFLKLRICDISDDYPEHFELIKHDELFSFIFNVSYPFQIISMETSCME